MPRALQARGLAPRLRKVFRDEDEVLASADLNDEITAALIASRFLIVVCSPYTPRSKWVAREIEIFNDLGRGDQVLALLTEGEPNDSFPGAMLVRERDVVDAGGGTRIVKDVKEPLAADVRPRRGLSMETVKRLALLRLVAVILGVTFDELRRRDQERERRGRRAWAAAAAAVCLLIGGAGLAYWDMTRPRTAYYRQLAWRWGLPEGVGEIDATTHDHLSRSYRVTTQRGKVIEARRDGWVRAKADGYAAWIVHYGADGSTERIEVVDPNGRLMREDVLERDPSGKKMVVTFKRGDRPLPQAATQNLVVDLLSSAPAPQAKSEITRQDEIFDDNGFIAEVRYQDYWGNPQADAQNSFGEHYSRSPDGLVIRSAEIGPNGEDITLKTGVHAVTFSYDADHRLRSQTR